MSAERDSKLPDLKEIGEVRQEIAGRVDERERKEILRSAPDYTESNSTSLGQRENRCHCALLLSVFGSGPARIF